MATPAYLRYANQGATRNLPLSPELASALGFLPELGITAEVFSGGQAAKGSGGPRTGSVRHDHGNAADVRFYRDGRQLDWANPDDLPLFQEIVQRGKANGLTGFGAGPNYMAPGTMHVGFGAPGVWGAGGRSANAPDWLRAAYGDAPAGSVPAGGGQETLYGGAGNDDLSGGSMPQNPMPNNPGGLGGLGGFVRSPAFGDWLTAVGTSMMSSGSDAPLENFGTAFANQQALRSRRDAAAEEREDRQRNRQALELALRSQGFTAEEAAAYSTSPQAASVAASGKEAQQARAQENQTLAWLRREHPDLADEVQAGLPITEGLRIASGRRNATGESAEVAERRNIAIANGIDPNTEEGQRYILTGNLPAGDKGVTAGDRQAIREADDLSRDGESVYGLLDEALKLSPDAYEGYSAGVRTSIGNNLPDWLVPDVIADPKTAETTRNYDNIITTQALGSLKSIFGGAPTEGERAILLDVQGMSSQPKNVREAIIKRAKDAVRRRVEFNRDRASELRGGTYYRPRDAAAPAPTAAPIVPGSDADPLGLR